MKVSDWLSTWRNLYLLPAHLAPSTLCMYDRAIHAISATLGDANLEDITALDIQSMLVCIAQEHPRAAQLDRLTLSRALHVAEKLHLCAPGLMDPDVVPMPYHTPAETRIFTRLEAQRYVHAIMQSPCYLLLLMCLICGLRRGEALGLRRDDIAGQVLTISRQRMRINRSYTTAPLKSASAHRSLTLPAELVRLIDAQPRTISGFLVDATPEMMHREHIAALCRANLPHVTIHGLRHTMATLAAAEGYPIKLLQITMGHSTYKLTADLYAAHPLTPSTAPALVWQGLAVI